MEATSSLDELQQIYIGFLDYMFVIGKNNIMHELSFSIARVKVLESECVLKIPVLVISLANGLVTNNRIRLCDFIFSQQASLCNAAS